MLFDYRSGRDRAGPIDFLKSLSYLQTKDYDGHNDIIKRPEVIAIGCMAHARRCLERAYENDRVRAEWRLSKTQQLYLLERQAREAVYSFDARYQQRQEQALEILAEIKI